MASGVGVTLRRLPGNAEKVKLMENGERYDKTVLFVLTANQGWLGFRIRRYFGRFGNVGRRFS